MTIENFRQSATFKFASDWGVAYPTIPVAYANRRFDQPTDGPWVNFMIVNGERFRSNIGLTKCFRSQGVLNIACMVPEESGSKLVGEMCDEVLNIFQDITMPVAGGGSASFYNAEIRTRGVLSGYYTMNVQLEFNYDEQI